jgi:hypothetical protein
MLAVELFEGVNLPVPASFDERELGRPGPSRD